MNTKNLADTGTWKEVGPVGEIPEGQPTGRRVDTTQLVFVRLGQQVSAVEALCPHKFAALEDGTIEDGCLVCPQHEAGFDPVTGAARPDDAWAGRLVTYPCRVIDGMVHVRID